MINDCLQKDPIKRPSATELLKYQFLKKGKDRKFLVAALIDNLTSLPGGPPKKDPYKKGSSGRFEKVGDEWKFEAYSDDEDHFVEEEEYSGTVTPKASTVQPPTSAGDATTTTTDTTATSGQAQPPLKLVLRLRNQNRELNDIKFEFSAGQDTVDGIAQELVAAGLIDGRDLVVCAANLQKCIDATLASQNDGKSRKTTIVFALNSGVSGCEIADEKTLVGFAQVSLLPADA